VDKDTITIMDTASKIARRLETSLPTLTLLSGVDVGRMYLLESEANVIGRKKNANVSIPHDSVSREHAELFVPSSGSCLLRDLNSTNGTQVNGVDIGSNAVTLATGDRLRLSKTIQLRFSIQDDLERDMQADLYSAASRDALTGAYNKRFFLEWLEQEYAHATRHENNLALAVLDLDHFKKINDTHGHVVGDQVLQEIAKRIHGTLRADDILARFGGEEFVVLMRGTEIESATRVAERIQTLISADPVVSDGINIAVTLSIGVSAMPLFEPKNAKDLFDRADHWLYEAKRAGRNCVKAEPNSDK